MKRALIALAAAGLHITGPALANGSANSTGHPTQLAAKTEMPRAGKIVMDGAWARATVSKNGVVYATFVNKGTTDDRLIGGRSAIAKRVDLHTTVIENDIMRMRPIKAIAVPAGKTVSMSSDGGEHGGHKSE